MIKQEPDYGLFRNWFTSHGGKVGDVEFPVKFGVTDYVGMGASEDIKANQVIIAIPKKLIISVSLAQASELGKIFSEYDILNDQDSEQTDFNILALYLLWQKGLGEKSFFYPYLQSITLAETIINWSDEDIKKIRDPYVTVDLVNEIREQFPPILSIFQQISRNHPQLFDHEITEQQFYGCYAIVMTRCFGWGLPETMMVPMADFMNHNCHGVHHYTFSRKWEQSQQENPDYIRKRKELNLKILHIDNQSQLPISYQRNKREQFIHQHRSILQKKGISYNEQDRMNHKSTRKQMQIIQEELLKKTYDIEMYPSSDSEDNDSEEDDLQTQAMKQKYFYKELQKMAEKEIQPQFEEPKPNVNREFEDNVKFDWWKEDDESNYFIVAADKDLKKGDQIFNSYGRRSNRFLLIWYGFTHFGNKYDSVLFRFWSEEAYKKTGHLVFAKYLTEKDWREKLRLGNQRFSYDSVTDEIRLKKSRISYGLLAYLRLRIMRRNDKFKRLYNKKQLSLHVIENLQFETEVLKQYQTVLKYLVKLYDPFSERESLSVGYQDYFLSLLLQSNRQILETHLKSIYILKCVVNNLQKGMSLQEAYCESYYVEEEQNQDILAMNRKPIVDYFKLLAKMAKKEELGHQVKEK